MAKQLLSERRVVDDRLLGEIKEYCKHAFGSQAYWPWLALYSEMKGEFKKGWMPDEYYRFKFLAEMNPKTFMKLSGVKTLDYKLFNNVMVAPLFFRSNGQYCSPDGVIISRAEVYNILENMDEEIIIKPDHSHGGENIIFKHASDLRLEELSANTDLLFQKKLNQHPELDKLYPHSINTFRVLTYIDSKGEVTIKYMYLRFGRGGNRVDNGGSGGGWIFVHPNGDVEPVAYDAFGVEIGIRHPDTGTVYADLEFPFLQKVTALCKNTHRTFPYLRIIGWDVFIHTNGEAQFIEWNANYPGFWAIEAQFGPFFDEVITMN